MILAKLLSAGKAVTTLSDAPTAYRMRHQARLPKFGSGDNPFVHADETSNDAAAEKPPLETTRGATAKSTSWSWKLWRTKSETPAAAKLAGRPSVRGEEAPASLLQGELSLDNVKVVRNDLYESDVELVLHSPDAGVGRPTVAAAFWPGPAVAGKALDRLAARLMGDAPQ